ncbi:MAG: sensor histidine kinase [Sphingomonadales bacterium]|nr:sensor histidine kinase [Sphingomonadales bacterium]
MQLAIVLSAVAMAAAVRWFADRGEHGAPFVTFLPIVMIAAIFLEWPYAGLSAIVSVITVIGLFGDHARLQATFTNFSLWGAFAFVAAFMIVLGHILRRAFIELDTQTEKIRSFNAELQHRTKNTLQIVRALASRAARSTDPVEFYNTLSGRLDAMAKANELLGLGSFQAREIADLVNAAIQPFPAWAIQASGPPCLIAGEPGMQLMMALHELGTNAMKYGALSSERGRVAIAWHQGDGVIALSWEEQGGPPVSPPTKQGLGSRILSPGGPFRTVDLDFRPEGLVCRLTVAAALD